ncbi:hypothetical protein SPRG_19341 [Saprolegnia parasitica CBS 223.65]|uniref:Roadblock/LAMTOR2 domain-containing protein n=1 Tax=Saprolegnia parasitica (strain CBS 223.65) TaxID=695850 RepID=A0A067D4W9_SAPPC|nr:hypothetical protein SPRG_19341 [Saprolegnia parasitica CBS 223.65]KDO33731.1 hypothetical protein SPRG_19341 [Saprolegnia parasitica CBS 223.65]|eukprot:XP_012195751.1 hypothetical protein SPRG_19341 [Saprolegnia parasitica CBS 223.65]
MANNAPNEVEETIKALKAKPGFFSYIVMNNDGIVIKYENMEYKMAVMHAYHILNLYARSKKYLTKLFDAAESDIECLRLRTKLHEMLIAQYAKFTLVVLQVSETEEVKVETKVDDTKEKEAEEKPAA